MIKLNKIYNEDCLETLKSLPDNYIDCVVTSPPYWGLRDYGLEPKIWGGNGCIHKWENAKENPLKLQSGNPEFQRPWREKATSENVSSGQFCKKCGAWRGNLGLEPSPELYVQHITEIFREIKRVLKKEGTLWLNLGDCYAGSWGNYGARNGKQRSRIAERWHRPGYEDPRSEWDSLPPTAKIPGLKPKNLVGIPWRVAFALQADGWYLRSDIIWHKPNPMPESVKDRPTRAHEYIFLLTKSAKYFYDADAIREEPIKTQKADLENYGGRGFTNHLEDFQKGMSQQKFGPKVTHPKGRNKHSVWSISTQPFPEAHFATFPEKLIIPCIKAGCPEGGIVYDPFMGAGTTALVALKLGRKFIGSELNPDYIEIANKRIEPYLKQLNLFEHAI